MWQTGKGPERVLGEGLGGQHQYLPLSSTLSLLLWEGSWEPKDSRIPKKAAHEIAAEDSPGVATANETSSLTSCYQVHRPHIFQSPVSSLSHCRFLCPLSLLPSSSSLSRPFQSLLNQPSSKPFRAAPHMVFVKRKADLASAPLKNLLRLSAAFRTQSKHQTDPEALDGMVLPFPLTSPPAIGWPRRLVSCAFTWAHYGFNARLLLS